MTDNRSERARESTPLGRRKGGAPGYGLRFLGIGAPSPSSSGERNRC